MYLHLQFLSLFVSDVKFDWESIRKIIFRGFRLNWSSSFQMPQLKRSMQYWYCGEIAIGKWNNSWCVIEQKEYPEFLQRVRPTLSGSGAWGEVGYCIFSPRNFLACKPGGWECKGRPWPLLKHNTNTNSGGSKGGRQGRALPHGPNSFIFMQFLAKKLKNNRLAHPPLELALTRKSWIRHWSR